MSFKYNILASAGIANRLKTVITKLINTDQSGFISGQYIDENTRLVYDLMQFAEENIYLGSYFWLILAFDSLSWTFIHKVLKFFNFGPSIQKWFSVFLKNTSIRVNQGGEVTSLRHLDWNVAANKGIQYQHIFILCAEILAIKIRNNEKIKGIKINNIDFKLVQFADDTTIILDVSENSLTETLNELENFAIISGLKVNFQKTQLIWIGKKV